MDCIDVVAGGARVSVHLAKGCVRHVVGAAKLSVSEPVTVLVAANAAAIVQALHQKWKLF